MVLSYEERVVNFAVMNLGCPYIWGAKGELKLFDGSIAAVKCFDCSGLVTDSIRMAGGPDLRATKNSQHLWDECGLLDEENLPAAWLEFYGADAYHVTHVAIFFGGWTVEAAGGDSTTLAPKPGACVMLHKGRYEGPGHLFLGRRLIPR